MQASSGDTDTWGGWDALGATSGGFRMDLLTLCTPTCASGLRSASPAPAADCMACCMRPYAASESPDRRCSTAALFSRRAGSWPLLPFSLPGAAAAAAAAAVVRRISMALS